MAQFACWAAMWRGLPVLRWDLQFRVSDQNSLALFFVPLILKGLGLVFSMMVCLSLQSDSRSVIIRMEGPKDADIKGESPNAGWPLERGLGQSIAAGIEL